MTDLTLEARDLIESGQALGAYANLLGGMGVKLACAEIIHRPQAREIGDIDVAILSDDVRIFQIVLRNKGYMPAKRFNLFNGQTRQIFFNSLTSIKIDLFIDYFNMCHKLDLRTRIRSAECTLALVDLLLTKLQIVRLTDKDLFDIELILGSAKFGQGKKRNRFVILYTHIV